MNAGIVKYECSAFCPVLPLVVFVLPMYAFEHVYNQEEGRGGRGGWLDWLCLHLVHQDLSDSMKRVTIID